jgi:hypothetical protein
MDTQYCNHGSASGGIGISGNGGKTCKGDEGEDVRRLRATERPLHFRLRPVELVHDVHLRQRSIDPGAVLALLSAKRVVPRPALLTSRLLVNARLGRSS